MSFTDFPVNQTSLTEIYSGDAAKNVAIKWMAIWPNGDSDEVQYNTRQEAFNSLCDMEDIIERCRFEMGSNMDAVEQADWISGAIEELANECGYKIREVLKWSKK